MSTGAGAHLLSPETLSASGRSSERLSLPSLQSKMKCDPEGYETELLLLYRHFDSSLHLFHHQSAISTSAFDPVIAKDLADTAMFLAHVTPFYPARLAGEFPKKLSNLLLDNGRSLPSSLRCHLTQALILLVNKKIVGIEETLELFMELQTYGDRNLRKLAFSHVVHSIRRMNQKHKDETKNRKLQSILFSMLQKEDELRAKRALIVLCDLHRRKVWFDDRTANAICSACFHTSSRIMVTTLSFLLGYERVEEDDSEGSSSEDDTTTQKPQIVLSREDVYKAHHKGTSASKKKKKAKLQRAVRSMKKQQRTSLANSSSGCYSPLMHLKDAQGFAEKLFSRLQKCNERFEVRMMMLKVIARTVGLHRLLLLNLYPFLQKYVQPHQRDVTNLLAAGVQACHEMVPPDAVEPLFRQIVNQFVHDRSRTEAIAVGLNVVREICLRMPLLMTEDLLQDLVLYKKSHEKAVSTAARSLITLFREVCPSLLVKKDRGRPLDPKARPKAFGEVCVVSNVPDVELLENYGDSVPNESGDDNNAYDSDDESLSTGTHYVSEESCDEKVEGNGVAGDDGTISYEEEDGVKIASVVVDDGDQDDVYDDNEDDDLDDVDVDDDLDETDDGDDNCKDNISDDDDVEDGDSSEEGEGMSEEKSKAHKRKRSDFDGQLDVADKSLRALKRLAGSKMAGVTSEASDGILSNEDFQRIKKLKAKKDLKLALTQQGLLRKGSDPKSAPFKIPSSEQLSMKPMDPAKLEINIKTRLTKEERLALVRAGREERGKYQARAAVKQKKTGGLSNRQKEHKKAMPLAAKKAKVARSRQEKKKQQRRSGKQFRGKKAWK